MAIYHFVGSDGATLTNAAVWSATQGGAGGAGTPGAFDTAKFDQTNASQITVTAGQDFGTLEVAVTAKVKVQAGGGIRHITSLVNYGLLTLAGGTVYTQDSESQIITWGTDYFVIQDITNEADLYTDSSLVLTGSVLSQLGIFGTSGYVWGTIPDEDALVSLYLASPGGTLAPGNYGFANVGQPSEIAGNTQNADELIDFFFDAPFTCTLTPGGTYRFFGFGGTSSDTYACTYTLDSTTIYATGIGASSHGAQMTVNALGTHFLISAPPTNVGSFLFGEEPDTTVLNWDSETLVEIVPGLNPDFNTSVLGGEVTLPRFLVNNLTTLAVFNLLGLPVHLDSLEAMPGSILLAISNGSGPVVVDHDLEMVNAVLMVIGPNTIEVGGNVLFSGKVMGGIADNGSQGGLELGIEGDFTVTGTTLDQDGAPGGSYRRSTWNTGGVPFSQSTILDIGGNIDVRDLEVYHVLSTRDIVSPSSIGCWNVRLDIVSNCPGRRYRWDDQANPGANQHPVPDSVRPAHQGDTWHRTIQAQTATRISRTIQDRLGHASDMAWRKAPPPRPNT